MTVKAVDDLISELESKGLLDFSKRARVRIDFEDAKKIAALIVNTRIDEQKACAILGLNFRSWAKFKADRLKSKRYPEFETLIAQINHARLSACLTGIEKAGRRDWRALAWLAEKIYASDRLRNQADTPPAPVVNVAIISDALKRVFDKPEPRKLLEAGK